MAVAKHPFLASLVPIETLAESARHDKKTGESITGEASKSAAVPADSAPACSAAPAPPAFPLGARMVVNSEQKLRRIVGMSTLPVSIQPMSTLPVSTGKDGECLRLELRHQNHILDYTPNSIFVEANLGWVNLMSFVSSKDRSLFAAPFLNGEMPTVRETVEQNVVCANQRFLVDGIVFLFLLLADGTSVLCHRQMNAQLFSGSIGGRGALGIITHVCFRLVANVLMEITRIQISTRHPMCATFKRSFERNNALSEVEQDQVQFLIASIYKYLANQLLAENQADKNAGKRYKKPGKKRYDVCLIEITNIIIVTLARAKQQLREGPARISISLQTSSTSPPRCARVDWDSCSMLSLKSTGPEQNLRITRRPPVLVFRNRICDIPKHIVSHSSRQVHEFFVPLNRFCAFFMKFWIVLIQTHPMSGRISIQPVLPDRDSFWSKAWLPSVALSVLVHGDEPTLRKASDHCRDLANWLYLASDDSDRQDKLQQWSKLKKQFDPRGKFPMCE